MKKLTLKDDPRVEKWVGWNFCAWVEIAGIRYRKEAALAAYRNYQLDSDVVLLREPTNQYDPNAVQVLFGNLLVGYLPAYLAESASKNLSEDMPIRAKYTKAYLGQTGYLELTIQPLMPDFKSRKANGWKAASKNELR